MRIERLRKPYQYRYVYAHGKTYADDLLMLVVCPAKGNPRVGISVSKKNGKAVVRNRIKRLIRESVRARSSALLRGRNYIVVASPKYPFDKSIALGTVQASFDRLLKRAGSAGV